MRFPIRLPLLLLVLLLLPAAPTRAEGEAEAYDALLGEVVKKGGVDYAALRAKRKVLDAYVASLEKAKPGESKEARIAFWINAYNALTLQQVLDTRKPGDRKYSVRDVKGFWTARKWTVARREVALDGIEKGILLKDFAEPRVHFAVNCASRSCPALRNGLYRADTLDADLTRQTRAYLANERENVFDEVREQARLSMIFHWYRADFEKDGQTLQGFLAKYAHREKVARSLRTDKWAFSYLKYDWSLNEAGVAPAPGRGGPGLIWWILYLVPSIGFLLYGLHAFKVLRWKRREGAAYEEQLEAARALSPLGRTTFPKVLVQVPVFNEPAVVERAIDAVAALDYPALEIQVLDDSTDATRALVDRVAARWRARGVSIEVIRRTHRTGFKAGALAAGLARSDAAYVAVFDADFVPAPDFIRRALRLFDVPGRVACVQGRWEHLNREQNWLTRAQAVGVDAHFHIQQLGRAAAGAFLNFSGTAGIWRRAAIDDAGGWRGDTLTEDLDLSYRAQLRGWRIVFDPGLAVPAELPPTLQAYKSQQRRWACGSTQCARRFLGPVWRGDYPLRVKLEATAHLCGYTLCIATTLLVVLLPFGVSHLAALARYPHLWPVWGPAWLAALGPVAVAIAGQRATGRRAAAEIVGCFLLVFGVCANNAIAALRGLTRPIRTFVRTPKQGTAPRPPRSPAPLLEQGMGLFTLSALMLLARTQPWGAVASYAAFCTAGFCCLTGYWWLHEKRA